MRRANKKRAKTRLQQALLLSAAMVLTIAAAANLSMSSSVWPSSAC